MDKITLTFERIATLKLASLTERYEEHVACHSILWDRSIHTDGIILDEAGNIINEQSDRIPSDLNIDKRLTPSFLFLRSDNKKVFLQSNAFDPVNRIPYVYAKTTSVASNHPLFDELTLGLDTPLSTSIIINHLQSQPKDLKVTIRKDLISISLEDNGVTHS